MSRFIRIFVNREGVYRVYSTSGPTLISIFDDRIEFITMNGLVLGISYDGIMLGISVLRNEHLTNIMFTLLNRNYFMEQTLPEAIQEPRRIEYAKGDTREEIILRHMIEDGMLLKKGEVKCEILHQ